MSRGGRGVEGELGMERLAVHTLTIPVRGHRRRPEKSPPAASNGPSGRPAGQPPAAGGVSVDSASSSTTSERRSIVPLR